MFEQDYLMKLLLQFFRAMGRSITQRDEEEDPEGAAETLENAIGEATNMDAGVLLSLSPESIAGVLNVSDIDPKVISYIAHSMLLESVYLDDAGRYDLARVREGQARALAVAYEFDLPDDPRDFESLDPGDAEEFNFEDLFGLQGI